MEQATKPSTSAVTAFGDETHLICAEEESSKHKVITSGGLTVAKAVNPSATTFPKGDGSSNSSMIIPLFKRQTSKPAEEGQGGEDLVTLITTPVKSPGGDKNPLVVIGFSSQPASSSITSTTRQKFDLGDTEG